MTTSRTTIFAMLAAIGLATAFTASGVQPAEAFVNQKTSYKFYNVRGRTAVDIVEHMHRYGTSGTTAFSKAYASLETDFDILGTTEQKRGRCRVKGFGLKFKFKVTLPKLVGAKHTTRTARRLFGKFQKFTKRHELHHRKLNMSCAKRAMRKIKKMRKPASCKIWADKAGDLLAVEFKRCNRKHEAFDRREQGIVLSTPLMRRALRQSRTTRPGRSARRLEREIRSRWNDGR